MMKGAGKGLGENISKLQSSGSVAEWNEAIQELFPDKVVVNFDVLGAFMKHGVSCYIDGSMVITYDKNMSDGRNSQLMK